MCRNGTTESHTLLREVALREWLRGLQKDHANPEVSGDPEGAPPGST